MTKTREGRSRAAPGEPPAKDGVQSIGRAISILRYLARGSGRGERLGDIAQRVDLKVPTARRILKGLAQDRMVLQVEGRRYVIGPLAAELGLAYKSHAGAIARWRPLLHAMTATTGATTYLIARGGSDAIVLDRVDGTSHIRATPFEIGQRHALGVGTGSLAILSSLDDQEVEQVLSSNEGEYRLIDGLDQAKLRSMIDKTRRAGYAMTFKTGLMPGVTGFSVALPVILDQLHLAVSIAFVGNGPSREGRESLKKTVQREIAKVRPR